LESPLSNGVTSALLLNLTAEKSAVYENDLCLLLLGFVSLITIVSQCCGPNNNTSTKLKEKWTFLRKKGFFTFFFRKTSKDLAGNFVEQVELYLNPKVHEK